MRFFHRYTGRSKDAFPLNKLNQWFGGRKQRKSLVPAYARSSSVNRKMYPNIKSTIRTITLMLMMISFVDIAQAQQLRAMTQEVQEAITPAKALEMLKEGNKRFVEGNMIERDLMSLVSQTATGQYPYAVVLGCIDSRVPPELIFDQGIGDIFTPRIAGNFVNTDILGSMEFATKVAGSKLIVVLGHSSCGAVKGACDHVELGNLTNTLSNLMPAVYAVDEVIGERNSSNSAYVEDVAHMNVKLTVENVLQRSPVMKELVEQGELMVVGAMHDVKTGKVTFMD